MSVINDYHTTHLWVCMLTASGHWAAVCLRMADETKARRESAEQVTTSTAHAERTLELAGNNVRVLQGGNGEPVVILHHSTGNVGWLPFFEHLAERFAVTVPDMPGYGQSERPEWAREPRDLAILLNELLDRLDLEQVTLVGLGFGGYVAAEMATMNQNRLKRLVLIGSAGLQPEKGEIADQMMVDFHEYVRAGFRSDEAYERVFGAELDPSVKELWDFSREMTARLTWKPYMFNRRLNHTLREVRVPTLLVWGSEDKIVPPECAEQFARILPNARAEIVQGAGHLVEYEEPERIAKLIATHING